MKINSTVTAMINLLLFFGIAASASASECFLGEVKLFAGNFAPRGYALAQGQLIPIAQNPALFSILGTTYGGDGRTMFALPDLRGRTPVGQGQGNNLSPVQLGEAGGSDAFTIASANLPATSAEVTFRDLVQSGSVKVKEQCSLPKKKYYGFRYNKKRCEPSIAEIPLYEEQLRTDAISIGGSGQSIQKRSPYLGINYIICTAGLFPSRN